MNLEQSDSQESQEQQVDKTIEDIYTKYAERGWHYIAKSKESDTLYITGEDGLDPSKFEGPDEFGPIYIQEVNKAKIRNLFLEEIKRTGKLDIKLSPTYRPVS
ncbi:MAG: hypothetical protein V1896_00075 [Candidatus Zambryskibacteria bacterium]